MEVVSDLSSIESLTENINGAFRVLYESVKQRKMNEILMEINNEEKKYGNVQK